VDGSCRLKVAFFSSGLALEVDNTMNPKNEKGKDQMV
jgi:hypothetical protein